MIMIAEKTRATIPAVRGTDILFPLVGCVKRGVTQFFATNRKMMIL